MTYKEAKENREKATKIKEAELNSLIELETEIERMELNGGYAGITRNIYCEKVTEYLNQ